MRSRERLPAILGLASLVVAIFVVGSAFRWVEAIVAVIAAAALVTQLRSRRKFSRIPPLVAMLATAAGLTALQLVPLPASVIDALQPVGASLRDDGAQLVATSPWQALTLDAPGSLRALCFFLILIGVAVTALRITVSSSGRYRALVAIGAVCGATAIVVGVHELVGATRLYGIYGPRQAQPTVLGPLLNANHLGCLMALGAIVGLGLAMHQQQRSLMRVCWLLQVAACAVTAVATGSRGSTLALVVGALILFGLLVGQRVFGTERRPSRADLLTTSLPIGVLAICTIVVIVYASAGGVSSELSRTSFDEVQQPKSKFAIWRSAANLLEETPWVGVGRGAFEAAITRHHPAAAVFSFSHAENEYLQAVVDWGLPGACLLALGVMWIVVTGFRRWREGPLVAGALGGLAVVALQSVVDFGVELLGLAIPTTILIAVVTYVPVHQAEGRALAIARATRGVLAAALLGAAALLVSSATTSIAEDRGRVSAPSKLELAELHDTLERHPLDYYGFALAAQVLYSHQDQRAATVLNHALRLHPTHGGLHHLAARMLVRSQHLDQAAIEYAEALRNTANISALLAEVTKILPPKYAAMAIPVDVTEFDVVIRELMASRELARRWLARVLEHRPADIRACDWLYSLAIRDQDIDAAQQAGRKCSEHALDQESKVALANMLLRHQRFAEAARTVRDVESWQGRIDLRVQGWLVLCDVSLGEAKWDEARRCLRRLDVSGLVQPAMRGQIVSRLERIDEQRRLIDQR